MSRETFNEFVFSVLVAAKTSGKILDFTAVPSYYYPRYYYSGSWNRLLEKAVPMTGEYTPKGSIPYSDEYLYSPTRVVSLVDFLHDVQYIAINSNGIDSILNPTDKVKPFLSQLNAKLSPPPLVSAITTDKMKYTLKGGEVVSMGVGVLPTGATKEHLTFKSDNTSVCTVTADGVITGHNIGSANITITDTQSGVTLSVAINVGA